MASALKYEPGSPPKEKLPSISKKVSWRGVSPTLSMSVSRRLFCTEAARPLYGTPPVAE